MAKWKTVSTIGKPKEILGSMDTKDFRLILEDGQLKVQVRVEDWKNITHDCDAGLIRSERSIAMDDDSGYIKIAYHRRTVAVLSLDGEIKVSDGFKVERAPGAKYSCNIFKKE